MLAPSADFQNAFRRSLPPDLILGDFRFAVESASPQKLGVLSLITSGVLQDNHASARTAERNTAQNHGAMSRKWQRGLDDDLM
jgi:hypothetical protein